MRHPLKSLTTSLRSCLSLAMMKTAVWPKLSVIVLGPGKDPDVHRMVTCQKLCAGSNPQNLRTKPYLKKESCRWNLWSQDQIILNLGWALNLMPDVLIREAEEDVKQTNRALWRQGQTVESYSPEPGTPGATQSRKMQGRVLPQSPRWIKWSNTLILDFQLPD